MFNKPCNGRTTSPFGMRTHPVTLKTTTMHWGVDYGNTPEDNSIWAAADGKVTYAKSTNGYGNTVMIVHTIKGQVYETVYAHLASIGVKVGQTVKAGQKIAVKGTTGTSTGIHLHFEVHLGRWDNKFTNAKNPALYVSDSDVKEVQQLLNKQGYKLMTDGISGNSTLNAIKDFQKKNNLDTDGVVGTATLALLKKSPNVPDKPTQPKPTIPAKGDVRMFSPSSQTLKKAVEEDFAQAVKDKVIDNKWLVQLQQGKLSLDDAFALRVIIEQRRNNK